MCDGRGVVVVGGVEVGGGGGFRAVGLLHANALPGRREAGRWGIERESLAPPPTEACTACACCEEWEAAGARLALKPQRRGGAEYAHATESTSQKLLAQNIKGQKMRNGTQSAPQGTAGSWLTLLSASKEGQNMHMPQKVQHIKDQRAVHLMEQQAPGSPSEAMASAVVTTGEGGGGWAVIATGKEGTTTGWVVGEGRGGTPTCRDGCRGASREAACGVGGWVRVRECVVVWVGGLMWGARWTGGC